MRLHLPLSYQTRKIMESGRASCNGGSKCYTRNTPPTELTPDMMTLLPFRICTLLPLKAALA